MSFFNELKRRNVFKVAVAYTVAAWLLLQIVDLVLENINSPDWVMQVFMLAMAVGLPIAIIIAWAFEVTPDGIKREKDIDRSQSITPETGKALNRGIIVILITLVVFLLTDKFRGGTSISEPDSISPQTSQAPKSIAVLPFRDMSAAGDQAYFGEGIAEELLNALVKLEGLQVASRTSAFSLAGEDLDIPSIAKRLGVATILEGSIRTSGQQVRVTAQLIDVNRDVHLWSETYNGSLDDIFKIQDEITGKIIVAMKVQLGGGAIATASSELTDNAEAYQLYLQGRHFWRQRTAESLRRAIKLFKQAIELDPGFHKAWSNMAVAFSNLPVYDHSASMEEYAALAVDAANQALQINPGSSEALTVIAEHHVGQCRSVDGANAYQKAIEANPQDPTAHHWYAIFLMRKGHINEALEQITLARQIDPLISAVISVEADLIMIQGDYPRAAVLARQAAELGIYQGSSYYEGVMEAKQGNFKQARQLMKGGLTGVDDAQLKAIALFSNALENPARTVELESFLNNLGDTSSINKVMFNDMLVHLGSSQFFNRISTAACPELVDYLWEASFREQRGTPEFFSYMEETGAVEYWRAFGWPDDCASLDQSLAECD